MRTITLFLLMPVALCLFTQAAKAEDPNLVFASDTEIVLSPFDQPLDRADNTFKRPTSGTVDCCSHPPDYRIIYAGTAENYPPDVPTIDQVFVDDVDDETLHIILSKPISLARTCTTGELQELEGEPCVYDLSDFKVSLRRIVMGKKKEPQGFEISVAPTVTDDFGTRESILYRGTHRTKDVPDSAKVVAKVVDVEKKTPIPTKVVRVESASKTMPTDGQSNWRIVLDPPLERGRTLAVMVSGIEQYNGGDMTAQGKIAVQPYPKGRDDAVFYLRGQKVFSRFGEDQGSADFKLENTFTNSLRGRQWWYLLSGTVGSDSLDLSQSITASIGKRWWIDIDHNLKTVPAWDVSLAPTFTIDSESKDRDLGLDLILEGQPSIWYHTIEQRKKTAADPKSIRWGFWLKPKLALEAGKQLASQAEEVEGKAYFRSLASFNLLLEKEQIFGLFDKISLTVDATERYLMQDEVTIDEMKVVSTSKGFKPYLRAELAYDLGSIAFSVVHENGKQPSAFKRAHATTVGVTVKF